MISNAIITLILTWAFMASVYTGVMFHRQRQIIRMIEMIYNVAMFNPNGSSESVYMALQGCDPDFVNIKLQIGRDKVVRIIYDVDSNEARCYVERGCVDEMRESQGN